MGRTGVRRLTTLPRPPAVARVLERATKTARAHDMFTSGDLVLVWVSGGPDSVCLLESLVRLRRLLRIRLAVFHMDHGLRSDSGTDAGYVRRLAHRHVLGFHLGTPADPPPKGGSIELWARQERARAAGEVAGAIGATRYADGHTMNDQAETILMGLVRGWGPEGLGGIQPVNGILVRPLLDVRRAEVEAFCRALHLRPRLDPTNADTSLLRNAIRRQGLPALERATGRELVGPFVRSAALARRDSAALWQDACALADRMVTLDGPRAFSVPAGPLLELPEALGSRVVRRAFQLVGGGWDSAVIDAVLDLAHGRPGRRRHLLLGSTAVRDREYVRVVVTRVFPREDILDDPVREGGGS